MAEFLFVDPVSDIAVLGAPDGQILSDKCKANEDFVSQATPLSIGRAKDGEESWLLALDGTHWFRCRVEVFSAIWISETAEPILGGISGRLSWATMGRRSQSASHPVAPATAMLKTIGKAVRIPAYAISPAGSLTN